MDYTEEELLLLIARCVMAIQDEEESITFYRKKLDEINEDIEDVMPKELICRAHGIPIKDCWEKGERINEPNTK